MTQVCLHKQDRYLDSEVHTCNMRVCIDCGVETEECDYAFISYIQYIYPEEDGVIQRSWWKINND